MRETRAQTALKKLYPRAFFQRIETSCGTGIFDANCLFPTGHEVWFEYKQVKKKKQHTRQTIYKTGLRETQKVWAIERLLHGAENLYMAIMFDSQLHIIHITKDNIKLLVGEVTFGQILDWAPDDATTRYWSQIGSMAIRW